MRVPPGIAGVSPVSGLPQSRDRKRAVPLALRPVSVGDNQAEALSYGRGSEAGRDGRDARGPRG
jgi:hypothetical protein